jgi:hypothetical protein
MLNRDKCSYVYWPIVNFEADKNKTLKSLTFHRLSLIKRKEWYGGQKRL